MIRNPVVPALAVALLTSCSTQKTPPAPPKPAAKVENRISEADLTRITLTPEAEKRLGIELASATETTVTGVLPISGELMLIPGKAIVATAPASGTIHIAKRGLAVGQTTQKGEPLFRLTPLLLPQRDLRVTYEADLQSAKVRLDTAAQQLQRVRQLLRDGATSQRNVEAAEQESGQAKAAHDAAAERLERLKTHPLDADVDMLIPAPETGVIRQVQVSESQTVAAGAPLIEVADLSRLWLRVPVYAGDVTAFASQSSVRVQNVDGAGPSRDAVAVAAPPTADPLAVTADLYFELGNPGGQLRPGQRMLVHLPARGNGRKGLAIPISAIVYDIHGGAWVYVNSAPHVFWRQRVDLLQTTGSSAILARGLAPGATVVKAGAAELFGTEFGAGK